MEAWTLRRQRAEARDEARCTDHTTPPHGPLRMSHMRGLPRFCGVGDESRCGQPRNGRPSHTDCRTSFSPGPTLVWGGALALSRWRSHNNPRGTTKPWSQTCNQFTQSMSAPPNPGAPVQVAGCRFQHSDDGVQVSV